MTAGSILRPLGVMAAVLVIVVLAVVAVSNLRGDDAEPAADGADETVPPAGPAEPEPGRELVVADERTAASVSCVPTDGAAAEYAVVISNQGLAPTDFVVAVSLLGPGDGPVPAVAEALELAPGERRQLPLGGGTAIGAVTGCRITALEIDRQVFLTGA